MLVTSSAVVWLLSTWKPYFVTCTIQLPLNPHCFCHRVPNCEEWTDHLHVFLDNSVCLMGTLIILQVSPCDIEFATVRLQSSGVWRSVACSLGSSISEEPRCMCLHCRAATFTLKLRAVGSSETLEPLYQNTWCPSLKTLLLIFTAISTSYLIYGFINPFMLWYCVNCWSFVASLAWDAYC